MIEKQPDCELQRVDIPDSDAVAALAALYSAERADNQNSLAQSLVLVSMLVAYSIGVGAIIATSPAILTRGGEPYLTLLLPLPVWAAVGFHVIVNALVFAHNQSIEVIEKKLRMLAGVPDWVGGLAGRLVSDAELQGDNKDKEAMNRRPLLYATLMAYGGTGLIVGSFTLICTILPIWQGVPIWICSVASISYFVLSVTVYRAWKVVISINQSNLDAWTVSFRSGQG